LGSRILLGLGCFVGPDHLAQIALARSKLTSAI
jgi:hypothetical protein